MHLEPRGAHCACIEEGIYCAFTIRLLTVSRYQDRWRYLKSVMSKSVECCYEDFAQCVIHPLQTNTSSTNSMSRLSPTKPFMYSNIQSTFSSSLTTVSSSTYETRWASHQSRARSRTLNEEEPSPTHEKGKQSELMMNLVLC